MAIFCFGASTLPSAPLSAITSAPPDRLPGDAALPTNEELRWYVVHTKAQQEWLANINLIQQGYETFYPHEIRTVRHAGRVDAVVRPSLSRYLFVALYDGQEIAPIRSTIGVAVVLHLNGQYLRVPLWVLDQLREGRDESGRLIERPKPESRLKAGDQITLGQGPFEGFVATIRRIDKNGSIETWVNGLKVSLPKDSIAA